MQFAKLFGVGLNALGPLLSGIGGIIGAAKGGQGQELDYDVYPDWD